MVAPIFPAHVTEFGGEHDLVPAAGYGFADELLVGERAVHVRCVQESHAQFYRAVDGRCGLLLVPRAVELAHPHAPEPKLRYDEPFATQISLIHRSLLLPGIS